MSLVWSCVEAATRMHGDAPNNFAASELVRDMENHYLR
jgi:hypothetical protein